MKLPKDIELVDSIEVDAKPEEVFAFLTNITDDETYRAWHEKDHVSFKWLKGEPWRTGSVAIAEEFLHGKLHKLKFTVTTVEKNSLIEYTPLSPLYRKYAPKLCFKVEPKGDNSIFTATVHLRLPLIMKLIAKTILTNRLDSLRQHMKEEGENLKTLVETS